MKNLAKSLFLAFLSSALFASQPLNECGAFHNRDGVTEKECLEKELRAINQWSEENLRLRIEGRLLHPEPMKKSQLHFYYTPNRKNHVEIPGVGTPCKTCNPLYKPYQRGVPVAFWRDYVFYPNNMPYLDNHIILLGAEEETQDIFNEKERTISNLIDLMKTFPNTRIYFNHLSGNSLKHFHAHLTTQESPLEKLLESKALELRELKKKKNLSISSFNNKLCYRGFLVSGTKYETSFAVYKIVRKILDSGYGYNVAFFPLNTDESNIVIFVRDERYISISHTGPGLNFDVVPASTELAGFMMYSKTVAFKEALASEERPYLDLNLYDTVTEKACTLGVKDPDVSFIPKELFEKDI